MAEGSTIADKLLETLARQRDEGLLSDEEYASRVEQLVRVPDPVVSDPLRDAGPAPLQGGGDNEDPENGEGGESTLAPISSNPPQIEPDLQEPTQRGGLMAPFRGPLRPDATTGRSDDHEGHVEPAEPEIAEPAMMAGSVPPPEGSGAVDEGPSAQEPHLRRRRFARKAKAPAAAEIQVPAPPPAGLPAPGGMSEERIAELKDKLRELEIEGWQAVCEYRGCGFYSARLTDDGLLVLPDGSVLNKWEAAVGALNGDETWASYRIEDERMVLLSAGSAALTYTASAQMIGETEYRAVITSVFVRRGDDWLIALRHETPIHPAD